MKNNWQKIWDRKGKLKDENNTLRKLLDVDGFDRGAGKVKVGNWKKYTEYISKKLGAGKGDSMYEVGCGAGAFLYQFYKRGHKVGGMDYSSSLVGVARDIMKGNFETGEAIKINTKNKYDFILANSVFQYFAHVHYAEHVVTKMLKKANKAVAILDVPDKLLKDKSEKNKCILCSSALESANLGNMCNSCKDRLYRSPGALIK